MIEGIEILSTFEVVTNAFGKEQLPISTIVVGGEKARWQINVDQKFNWLQRKMLKWCFGFEVKENK